MAEKTGISTGSIGMLGQDSGACRELVPEVPRAVSPMLAEPESTGATPVAFGPRILYKSGKIFAVATRYKCHAYIRLRPNLGLGPLLLVPFPVRLRGLS
jgi:hypothetical protein